MYTLDNLKYKTYSEYIIPCVFFHSLDIFSIKVQFENNKNKENTEGEGVSKVLSGSVNPTHFFC